MKLFGEEFKLRTHYCRYFNTEPELIENPYINLYVRFYGCNATCQFCEYHSDCSKEFDEDKLIEIIKELTSKLFIKKLNITGGEPTLNYERFLRVFNICKEHLSDKTMIVVNTNGYNFEKLIKEKEIIKRVTNISLSRHHYDDNKNNEILGFQSVSYKTIKKAQKKLKPGVLNLTCNLIKGYIDSTDEVYKYLEFASKIGVDLVGLVSLMKINDYCHDNFIDFNTIDLISKRFNLTKQFSYKDCCKCNNYVYIPENLKLVRVYHKNTYKPLDIDFILSYDGKDLKRGF